MIQYLVTAIIDIIVGMVAISKKNNPAAKALGMTICCLGAWSLELFFLTIIKNYELLSLLFHITRWGMFIAPSTFALLTWNLVDNKSKKFKWLVLIPSIVMSFLLCIGNFLFFPSTLVQTDGGYLPKIDGIYYAFGCYFLWCFLGSLLLVGFSFKAVSNRKKQRLKWLLITLIVCFIVGMSLILVMNNNFYLSKFVGPIANIIFVAFLFYSTVQHNLMDFRLALSVSLSKFILLGFFVWMYFVVTAVVGDHTESTGGILVLLAFITLILEAYPRLLRWVLPNAKKILVKHGYEFDQVRDDTESALRHTLSFQTMFDVLNHLFYKIIRVTNYRILFIRNEKIIPQDEFSKTIPFEFIDKNDPLVSYCLSQRNLVMADELPPELKQEIDKYQAGLCFVVESQSSQLRAIVLMGKPMNLSYYRYDDIRIFEWLEKELGQVLNRLLQLEQMQEQLGEAKKTLSMLGMMSHYHHDIKAPFAIIDGVLSNDIYDRDKQKDIVLEQVERGSRLIATMASILGGKRRRRVQPCDIETLIRDCLFVFGSSIDQVNYELQKIPRIAGDAEDLKILFINLIKNATEARRANEELILTVKSFVQENTVHVAVKDNGVGMTQEQLNTIWDQGFSAKEFGNGIGMQAIKRIADEHNAKISVSSEPGQGTEFTIIFSAASIVGEENESLFPDEFIERRGIKS